MVKLTLDVSGKRKSQWPLQTTLLSVVTFQKSYPHYSRQSDSAKPSIVVRYLCRQTTSGPLQLSTLSQEPVASAVPWPFHTHSTTFAFVARYSGHGTPTSYHICPETCLESPPTPSTGPRAFQHSGPSDLLTHKTNLRVGGRYLVKADIQNFYPPSTPTASLGLFTQSPWPRQTLGTTHSLGICSTGMCALPRMAKR